MEYSGQVTQYIAIPKKDFEKLNEKIDLITSFVESKKSKIDEFYNEKEVMAILDIKTTSMWELRKSGYLKCYKVGRKKFYKKIDLLKLIEDSECS
jgi:hypothetical protein